MSMNKRFFLLNRPNHAFFKQWVHFAELYRTLSQYQRIFCYLNFVSTISSSWKVYELSFQLAPHKVVCIFYIIFSIIIKDHISFNQIVSLILQSTNEIRSEPYRVFFILNSRLSSHRSCTNISIFRNYSFKAASTKSDNNQSAVIQH